ncbi:ELL-associated factor 1-like [Galendromus occidentalis]|uniref:Ell-associated factor Eaf n=1 Tax=Galendromus occidentalis TaxID=34638 RepID=A0AAJ7L3G5_9ACAR|nr:ELL-associated factor 1-like [Galendromus occidentalis]
MDKINIGEKLGLTGKVMKLKFGNSFDRSARKETSGFHTFKYDFKPASVDASQGATVDVEKGQQISVTIPHHDSSSSTTFRGNHREYSKECVLIIDQKTGEVTLERLSCNVQLKKTRAEKSSKAALNPTGRPVNESAVNDGPSAAPAAGKGIETPQPSNARMKKPLPAMPQRRSEPSIGAVKRGMTSVAPPRKRISKPRPVPQPIRPHAAALAPNSMPILIGDSSGYVEQIVDHDYGGDNDESLALMSFEVWTNPDPLQFTRDVSSSGNFNREASSSGNFTREALSSGNFSREAPKATSSIVNKSCTVKSSATPLSQTSGSLKDAMEMSDGSSSSDSDSGSDDSDSGSEDEAQSEKEPPQVALASRLMPPPAVEQPMPKPSLLIDDLQLSESGSDSE